MALLYSLLKPAKTAPNGVQQLVTAAKTEDGVIYMVNPLPEDLFAFTQRTKLNESRGLFDGKDYYWWDSYLKMHCSMAKELGLNLTDSRYYLNFSPKEGFTLWGKDENSKSLEEAMDAYNSSLSAKPLITAQRKLSYYWVLPDGKVLDAGAYGHWVVLQDKGIVPKDQPFADMNSDKEYQPAFDLGWVRVSGDSIEFSSPKLPQAQAEAVEDLMVHNNHTAVNVRHVGNNYGEWADVEGLAKALMGITRHKLSPAMISASLKSVAQVTWKVPGVSYDLWVLPSGETIPADDVGHFGILRRKDMTQTTNEGGPYGQAWKAGWARVSENGVEYTGNLTQQQAEAIEYHMYSRGFKNVFLSKAPATFDAKDIRVDIEDLVKVLTGKMEWKSSPATEPSLASSWYKRVKLAVVLEPGKTERNYLELGHKTYNGDAWQHKDLVEELWVIEEIDKEIGRQWEFKSVPAKQGQTHYDEFQVGLGGIPYVAHGRYEKSKDDPDGVVSVMWSEKYRRLNEIQPQKADYYRKSIIKMLEKHYGPQVVIMPFYN